MLPTLYLRLAIGAALLLAVLGGVYAIHHKLTTLKTDLAASQAKNADLTGKLQLQNDAVAALKSDADQRLARAQSDLEAAKTAASAASGKATIIYKTLPAVPGDDCRSALDMVNAS